MTTIQKKKINAGILKRFQSPKYFPIFLLVIAIVTYGILIPALGFYGDDFTLAWLAYRVGSVDSFFTNNRPVYGQLFLFLTRLIPFVPWVWHLVFLMARWLLSFIVFKLFRSIKSIDERAAYWISILFLVYPGALIFYMPVTFLGLFLTFAFLFTSFWCTLNSLQNKKSTFLIKFAGLVLELLNLITIEYLYFLELFRYVLVWFVFRGVDFKTRLQKVLMKTAPNLFLFVAVSVFRFFYQSKFVHYEPTLLKGIFSDPFNTLIKFAPVALRDLFNFGVKAWLNFSQLLSYLSRQGRTTSFLYLLFVTIAAFGIYFYYPDSWAGSSIVKKTFGKRIIALIFIALIALFLGGLPPWIAGLETSINPEIHNRFSLGFTLGASILVAGFLLLISR